MVVQIDVEDKRYYKQRRIHFFHCDEDEITLEIYNFVKKTKKVKWISIPIPYEKRKGYFYKREEFLEKYKNVFEIEALEINPHLNPKNP